MLMPGMGRRNIFGAPMMQDAPTAPYMPPEPAATGFQKPSTGALIAGVIGDTLSQVGGGQGMFLPALYRQQEMAAKARMEAAQRNAEYTDFTRRHDYEVAHPKAINNDTVNDYNFIAGKLGQGEADKYLRSVAAGPPVAIEGIDANGNQTRTLVPRSQAYGGSGPATPPQGAVQMLRSNPSLASQFDQKYGAGAASRILGGAGPQGSATFP